VSPARRGWGHAGARGEGRVVEVCVVPFARRITGHARRCGAAPRVPGGVVDEVVDCGRRGFAALDVGGAERGAGVRRG